MYPRTPQTVWTSTDKWIFLHCYLVFVPLHHVQEQSLFSSITKVTWQFCFYQLLLSVQNVFILVSVCILGAMISQQSFLVFSNIIWFFFFFWLCERKTSHTSAMFLLCEFQILAWSLSTQGNQLNSFVCQKNKYNFYKMSSPFSGPVFGLENHTEWSRNQSAFFFPLTLVGWRDTQFSQPACIYNSKRLGKIPEVIVV